MAVLLMLRSAAWVQRHQRQSCGNGIKVGPPSGGRLGERRRERRRGGLTLPHSWPLYSVLFSTVHRHPRGHPRVDACAVLLSYQRGATRPGDCTLGGPNSCCASPEVCSCGPEAAHSACLLLFRGHPRSCGRVVGESSSQAVPFNVFVFITYLPFQVSRRSVYVILIARAAARGRLLILKTTKATLPPPPHHISDPTDWGQVEDWAA